ncbi:MAG: hypothetical protein WCP97_00530 [bacterium]
MAKKKQEQAGYTYRYVGNYPVTVTGYQRVENGDTVTVEHPIFNPNFVEISEKQPVTEVIE